MCTHASTSLEKFQYLKEVGFEKPLTFTSETPNRVFIAYIDPHKQFHVEDRLSQINTLQQLQNIASYGFLKKRLESHDLHLHALWFDIYTGEIYFFSRAAKQFLPIDTQHADDILKEVRKYYS